VLVIDSHAHLYAEDEWSFPARPDARRPAPGVGSIRHLVAQATEHGVRAAVAIQTASFYGWDTRYAAHLARTEPDWLAVVCSVDPEDPRGPERLASLVTRDGVRGIRILTISSGHLDAPEVRSLLAAATDLGIVVNVLTSVAHAAELERLLDAFPATTIVIEHGLSLNRSTDDEASVRALTRLATHPNAVVELCDLPATSREPFPFEDRHQVYRAIIDAFGPDRCVWGSCYPVEFWVPRTTLRESIDVFRHGLGLADDVQADILGRTAARLWFPGLVEPAR
jgi:predicted TIM-barrel fold metal-dependent hydrolase